MIVNQPNMAALSKSFQILFLEAYAKAISEYEKISMTVPSSAKAVEYAWLGNFPNMQEWVGDRVISALKAHKYAIENKSWSSGIEVDRDDIEDDTYGVYSPMIQTMGEAPKNHMNSLVFSLLPAGFDTLCFDGQYFFDSDHPVGEGELATVYSNTGGGSGTPWYMLCTTLPIKPLIFQMRRQPQFTALDQLTDAELFKRNKFQYGADYRGNAGYGLWQLAYASKDPLNATNYQAARVAMMSQKNDAGVPMNIKPNLLVVPPSLEGAGKEILTQERNDAGATNIYRNTCELMTTTWLA